MSIKMPNPSQDPPASSKAPNGDFKDMDDLCTFKIKIESQNSEYGCTKDQWPYPNLYQDDNPQSGTSSILKSPKSGLEGLRCSLHPWNQDRYQNSGYRCINDQWTYPDQDQDANPQSGTSSILQNPNEDLKDMDVLCTFKIKIESQNLDHGYTKDHQPYTNQDQ